MAIDSGPSKWRRILDISGGVASLVAAVVMLVLGVTILNAVRTGPGPNPTGAGTAAEPVPAEPVDTRSAHILGSAEAPVVLVEFSDFQCPVCVRFSASALPTLKQAYVASGKLALVFRHFPLDIHPLAFAAAEASECAAVQGKFWQMHDALFGLKGQLEGSNLNQAARSIGLDSKSFENCMTGAAKSKVGGDMVAAEALGLHGTPTFLVGIGKPGSMVRITARFSGIPKPDAFSKAVDAALEQAHATPAAKH